jgi:hypothetical protein
MSEIFVYTALQAAEQVMEGIFYTARRLCQSRAWLFCDYNDSAAEGAFCFPRHRRNDRPPEFSTPEVSSRIAPAKPP